MNVSAQECLNVNTTVNKMASGQMCGLLQGRLEQRQEPVGDAAPEQAAVARPALAACWQLRTGVVLLLPPLGARLPFGWVRLRPGRLPVHCRGRGGACCCQSPWRCRSPNVGRGAGRCGPAPRRPWRAMCAALYLPPGREQRVVAAFGRLLWARLSCCSSQRLYPWVKPCRLI